MSKSKGISLHLGLNRIDPTHYGTDGSLAGCEADARAMARIAEGEGFSSTILLNEGATSSAVLQYLEATAMRLAPQDIFLLTYAGHGSQVPDASGDEADERDETWCLFDRMLLDDELRECWARFPAGCRITMVSDSCHNGTVARVLATADALKGIATISREFAGFELEPGLPRVLPTDAAMYAFACHPAEYARARTRSIVDSDILASVLLISGCQDNQTSADGSGNGLFTGNLLKVWANGGFEGSYESFHRAICNLMPPLQTPNYYFIGAPNERFEAQRPFTIIDTSNGGMTTMNDITGLDPRVARLLENSMQGAGNSTRQRGIGGECSIKIGFDRALLDGLNDQQLLQFFQSEVAPRIMDNYLTVLSAVNPVRTRGGSVSCTASTGGGGTVSCTGSLSW